MPDDHSHDFGVTRRLACRGPTLAQDPHRGGESTGRDLESAIGREVRAFRRSQGMTVADLTQATARPATTDPVRDLPPAAARRRRVPWLAAGAVALALGGGTGWAMERAATTERTLQDATGQISVTVPEAWATQVDPERWTPMEGQQELPSLATGSKAGWNTDADPAVGVFVGMLAGEKLPSRVPGHPDCESSDGLVRDTRDGDASMTVYFVGCPGPQFIVERVVQLTSNRLLWVQVRSDDRGTANRVLASVDTIGI